LLGLYLSQHPLEAFEKILSELTVPLAQVNTENDSKTIEVGGIVNSIRQITTKNGQPMAFVKIEDLAGDECELVVFPNTFKDNADVWQKDKVQIIKGKINGKDKDGNDLGEAKIIVDSARIVTIEEAKEYEPTGVKKSLGNKTASKRKPKAKVENSDNVVVTSRLYIRMLDASNQELLKNLKILLDRFPGDYDAVLVLGGENKQIIKLPQHVAEDVELITELQSAFGQDNVKFQ